MECSRECRHSCRMRARHTAQPRKHGRRETAEQCRALAKRCWCEQRQSQRTGRARRHHGITLSEPAMPGYSRTREVTVSWDVHMVRREECAEAAQRQVGAAPWMRVRCSSPRKAIRDRHAAAARRAAWRWRGGVLVCVRLAFSEKTGRWGESACRLGRFGLQRTLKENRANTLLVDHSKPNGLQKALGVWEIEFQTNSVG